LRRKESEQKRIAEENATRARLSQSAAETQRSAAVTARRREQTQREIAETNLREAKDQKQAAEQQRLIATQQAELAKEKQRYAEGQKSLAEQRADQIARLLYASQINRAQQAWESSDTTEMKEALSSQIPEPGGADLRGFEWYFLWRLCHLESAEFHDLDTIRTVRFSPDGRLIAIGGSDENANGRTVLVDGANAKEIESIPDRVALGFTQDGRLITSDSWNKADSKIEFRTIESGPFSPSGISLDTRLAPFLSDDGALIATENLVQRQRELYGVQTGSKIFSFKGRFLPTFKMMAFSTDRKLMAASEFGKVRIFDLTTGTELSPIETKGFSFAVEFSPDATTLAVAAGGVSENYLTLYDISTRKLISVLTPLEPAGSPHYISFSPDGRMVAAAGDRVAKLWDVATKKELLSIASDGRPFGGIIFSPGGRSLATWSDRSLRVWALPDLNETIEVGKSFRDSIILDGETAPRVTPDGANIVTIKDGKIQMRDAATLRQVAMTPLDDTRRYRSVRFSPDGRFLSALTEPEKGSASTLELYDRATQRRIASTEGVDGHTFAAAASVLALARSDGKIEVRQVPSFATIRVIGDRARNFAISPDGGMLALMGENLELVDVRTGERREVKAEGTGWALAFSPDGKTLAVAARRSIIFLDVANLQETSRLRVPSADIESLAFSPDGSRIAVAQGRGGTLSVWDVSTKQSLLGFPNPRLHSFVAFSPDGRSLIVSGINGSELRIGPKNSP
jgi:WD40 repeat protein